MDDTVTLNRDIFERIILKLTESKEDELVDLLKRDGINNLVNVNSREESPDSTENTENMDVDSLPDTANTQEKNNKIMISVKSMDKISNKKQLFLDDSESTSGGLTLCEHGNIFQLKLLMLCLWRATHAKENGNKKYTEFRLATEMPEAEKFDDVVFQYKDCNSSKWKFRLLQAKHKEANSLGNIKLRNLLSTDNKEDFSLQKYFHSYLKIKQRTNENSIYSVFSDSEIQDVIIITNAEFDSEKEKNLFNEYTEKDILLETKGLNSTIKVCKLNSNNTIINKLKIMFENSSDFYKLIELLAEHISSNKQIDKKINIFKEYYYPLVANILKINEPGKKKNIINLSNLINETVLSKEENEIRNSLIKEMAFRKGKVKLPEIDKKFGNKILPNDKGELKDLAKKFADTILKNKKLIIHDFEAYHIALANKVVSAEDKKIKETFIRESIKRTGNKEPTILGKFKKYLLKALNKSVKELEYISLNISEDFGINKLPSDVEKLNELANKLAEIIVTNKKLALNDFQNTHVILSEQVIDTKAQTFHKIFINGKEERFGKLIELSPETKKLRRLLLNEFEKHDVKIELNEQEITINKLGKDKQCLQKLLNGAEIKVSEGFVESFKSNKNPDFGNVDLFAEQMKKLIIYNEGEKVIEINDGIKKDLIINDQQFNIFYDNIKKLAGHVLINRFTKVRFSTHFLNLESDNLPKEINGFKSKLKTLLGDQFDALFKYELKFDEKLKFNTCEDGELYRKLPVPHSEGDVNDFLSKLKLIVNYPNRMEINDLLSTEIKDKLNTLDSKVFQSLYYENLHNWMADRVGTFYTADKAKTLFREMQDNLSSFTIDGFNKPYFANSAQGYKFEKYDILDKFLVGAKQVLVLGCQDLLLGHTRIVQRFQELQAADTVIKQYTRKFGHIFLYSRQFAYQAIKETILKALENKCKFNLIVIECDDQYQEIEVLFAELYETLKFNNNKKVIFITTKDNDTLVKKFANNPKYKIEVDKTDFHDLTKESQKQLLEQTVILQGQKVSINQLIDEMAEKIIDTETLVKILKCEEIKIGNTLQGLDEVNDYYIDRGFNVQIAFNKDIIKNYKKGADIFVISGSDNKFNNIENIYVTDNDKSAEDKFRELCGKYRGSNIHWLKSDSEKLTWTNTYGSISNLIKYKVRNGVYQIDNKLIEKKKLIENNNIVIISDNAGMGKSTLLTTLSMELKKMYPSLWVIRINLNEYTNQLKKELDKRKGSTSKFIKDVNKTIDFLLNDLLGSQEHSKLKTKLEKELFENSFRKKVKIAWLFDGFDEIVPNYGEIVIDLLCSLKNSEVTKLFVTTNINMRGQLEKALNVFSCSLNPLTKEEQIEFFTKFWWKNLKLTKDHEERLNLYANTIIHHFSEQIHDENRELISNPLHAKMVAEVFQSNTNRNGTKSEWQGCKEFLESEESEEAKITHAFSIIDLYENFIKRKFNEFYLQNKKGRDFSKVDENEAAKVEYATFQEDHEILALDIIFDSKYLKSFLPKSEVEYLNTLKKKVKTGSKNIGFVYFDESYECAIPYLCPKSTKPCFSHTSFAEYFVANRIYRWLERDLDFLESRKTIIADVLIQRNFHGIQTFLDKRLILSPTNKWGKIFNLIMDVYEDHNVEVYEGQNLEYILKQIAWLSLDIKYPKYLIEQMYEKTNSKPLFINLIASSSLFYDRIERIISVMVNYEEITEIGRQILLTMWK